jgi:hypothetical protein
VGIRSRGIRGTVWTMFVSSGHADFLASAAFTTAIGTTSKCNGDVDFGRIFFAIREHNSRAR